MRSEKRWRQDVWRIFEREGFTPAEIMAAMVMAGIAAVGINRPRLVELTGCSDAYVLKVIRRLRKQRILSGQSLRLAWDSKSDPFAQRVAVALDAGVAAGTFARFVDPKRSAAQKARKPETRARGPRGPRKAVDLNTVKLVHSNPLYGLPEWEQKKEPRS